VTRRSGILVGGLLLATVGVLSLLPVLFALVGSFNGANVGAPWRWAVSPWLDAFHNPRTLLSLAYSFLLTIRVPLGVLVGFVLAWLLVRVEIPGRRFIEFSLWIAYFLPSLPIAVGWVLLLHKDYGLVNHALIALGIARAPVFDVHSVQGILWVHLTLTTIPVMMILLAPSLRQLDASLEQSARVCGSGALQTLRRILIPILAPALLTSLLAGFIRGLEAFEIEQVLGIPAGIYVYPTRVYDLINVDPPDFPQAMALSTALLLVLFVVTIVYQAYAERGRVATVTGRGVTFAPVRAGRWRWAASVACITYIAVGLALPLALLLLGSFMQLFGFFDIADPFTLQKWKDVLGDPIFLRALRNSVVVGLAVAGVGVVLYALLAYVIARSRLPGRRLLSALTWLPWSVPGILLGMSFLWLYLAVPGLHVLYGTLAALVVVLVIQSMPLGTQMLRTSFAQIGDELEHASAVCGAGWLTTFRRIMLPLAAPMLVSIFVLTFMQAIRDIGSTVLLANAETRPLSLLMMEFTNAGDLGAGAVVGVILSAMAIALTLVLGRLGLQVTSGIRVGR
jgi:iron(III) transport system permease protein